MRRTRTARGPRRLFFLLVFLPMLCVFPYVRNINNPNEFTRVFTAMAIVEKHTFVIDEQVQLWGWVNDMARVPSKTDGVPHYFMVKAPGAVYLGVPGYFLFSKVVAPMLGHHYPTLHSTPEERLWWLRMSTWALRLFASNIPCFLFLLWFDKYLRDFTGDALIRYSAVAAAGLGTNYLAYTHMFASHAQYAVVAFLAFATIERELRLSRGDAKKRRVSRALLAGFLTSACVTFEYHSLFLTIIFCIFAAFVFWRPTRLLAFAVGGLSNVPGVMYFHWKAYGNPLTPGHQMLETQRFAIEHRTGLWGVVWPTWEHIRALAVDPGFGFFGMSPFMWIGLAGIPLLLLSPYGLPSQRRAIRRATFVWALSGLVLFLVNAGIIEWRAGWTIGPRYLAACPPFFAFGAALALERFARAGRIRRALARGFGGGLALASVVSIGTVSLLIDTLPEAISRPFAQFSVPLMVTGFVPHHIGEWFGWDSIAFWYVVCAAMLAAPILAGLWPSRSRLRFGYPARVLAFVSALAIGMAPALSKPDDGTELFVLHPSCRFLAGWEPKDRDRITLLRTQAERYNWRRPCMWQHLAKLDRMLGDEAAALQALGKAGDQSALSRCPKVYF
jgi:hypothetical protein